MLDPVARARLFDMSCHVQLSRATVIPRFRKRDKDAHDKLQFILRGVCDGWLLLKERLVTAAMKRLGWIEGGDRVRDRSALAIICDKMTFLEVGPLVYHGPS
jgi:hypothetical protein